MTGRRVDGWLQLGDLVAAIRSMHRGEKTILVGIDGAGGSGKSSLAQSLRGAGGADIVVEMDDFYLPASARAEQGGIGGNFDWTRLQSQVLQPLRAGVAGNYQRYDWDNDALAEWHEVRTGGVVVVEGIYSLRRELKEAYDLRLFVECPRDLRLRRGLDRDGEEARQQWELEWMPAEAHYFEDHRPDLVADLVIDGSGRKSHDGWIHVLSQRQVGPTRTPDERRPNGNSPFVIEEEANPGDPRG